MYVESHALGMPIIAVPPCILVVLVHYNVFGNGRQIFSILSTWLSGIYSQQSMGTFSLTLFSLLLILCLWHPKNFFAFHLKIVTNFFWRAAGRRGVSNYTRTVLIHMITEEGRATVNHKNSCPEMPDHHKDIYTVSWLLTHLQHWPTTINLLTTSNYCS